MTFQRAFPAQIERTGPRQLTGRLVPYDEPTDVLDVLPDGVDIYREGFRYGAFAPQANTTEKGVLTRIGLVHRHEGGLGYLGNFTALREERDGLYGDVAILRSKAGDVEDLLDAGVRELSIEFHPPGAGHTEVDEAGIRWRTRAHLHRVALEPQGAYSSAQVLAFRAEVDHRQVEHAGDELAARRRRWDELTGRLPALEARQAEMVRQYGITRPPEPGIPRSWR